MERGRRPTAYRLRRGLDEPVTAAGLRGRGGAAASSLPKRKRPRRPRGCAWRTWTPPLVGSFLHLETDRGNSARTRNARLAAIHSLFRFAALRHPELAALIERVLAIPTKRFERALVSFLTDEEVDALLADPVRATAIGRRDHALLLLDVQTGHRVSELLGLRRGDVVFGGGPHVRCVGKGRKERITPLTKTTVAVPRAWMDERMTHCSRASTPTVP
jgi:integrase